ncbi:MAG: SulP family inorganic anion transporter [Flavobacteriales bacterium]
MRRWFPALHWMPQYGRHDWLKDLPAGLTVGVMLVPQGMAYAMIAGLPVVYGLYAALIPQVVYALMGTSRQLAVGPVAMDSLLVAAGLGTVAVAGSDRYIELALLLALMMGGLQLLLGTFRLGFLAHFISKPVISGFTSAAALIIGLNQLPHLTGIALLRSSQLHQLVGGTLDGLAQFHVPTFLLGAVSVALLIGLRKVVPRVPGSLVLVVLALAGGAVVPWGTWDIRTVGAIPAGLPGFHVPGWTLGDLQMLFPLAATLALVAFMEAYSVAQAVAQKRGDHEIDANQELRALGSANAIGSLFGAYPVTGGFSRTAVNERAGAVSGMSSLIAAGIVALALTFLTPVFQHLPTAALGAIITVAVAGLVDLATLRRLWRTHRDEAVLLLLTFGLTAFGGMVLGIASGVVLGLTLTLFRTTRPHTAELGEINGVYRNLNRFPEATKTPGILLVRYDGPLNYASQGHFKGFILSRLAIRKEEGDPIRTVVLSAESIPYLDATGTDMLTALLDALEADSISLKVAGAIGPVRDVLERAGLMERIGRDHFHTGIPAALGIEEIRPRIATQTFNSNNS